MPLEMVVLFHGARGRGTARSAHRQPISLADANVVLALFVAALLAWSLTRIHPAAESQTDSLRRDGGAIATTSWRTGSRELTGCPR